MDNRQHDSRPHALRAVALQWLGDTMDRYLARLQDNFNRRAQSAANPAEKDDLLSHRQLIALGKETAHKAFFTHILHSFDRAIPYSPAGSSPLDRLHQHCQTAESDESARFQLAQLCRSLTPTSILAGFQHLAEPLRLDQHRNQALNLFQILVVRDLGQLYTLLDTALKESQQVNQLREWIAHIEHQLHHDSLSAQERALNAARLQRLKSRLSGKLQSVVAVDDDDLLAEVGAIFELRHLAEELQRRSAPDALRSTLNRLRKVVTEAALKDREDFLNPLHPVRQISRQIIAATAQWEHADPDSQQQFATALKLFCGQLEQNMDAHDALAEPISGIDRHCRHMLQLARLDRRRLKQLASGKRRVADLRREVHAIIDDKTQHAPLPASIDNMLHGPLTSILLYHWLRHGSNSSAMRRNLQLVDDILWYIKPHHQWQELRRAKDMAISIEQRLHEGLERINYNPTAAQAMIDELHQLRVAASSQSRLLSQRSPY